MYDILGNWGVGVLVGELQWQFKDDYFGIVVIFQCDLCFVVDLQCIIGFQGDVVDLELVMGDLYIGVVMWGQWQVYVVVFIQDGCVDVGILVDQQ